MNTFCTGLIGAALIKLWLDTTITKSALLLILSTTVIRDQQADSFTNDLHKDLKADYILANPPFNISDWWNNSLSDDVRLQYGTPPKGNANYGWVQHMIHHLAPKVMC